MAIVLTDGDPTAYGTGQGTHGPPSNVIDVENAVPSSNAAKTAGVNIVGVGITSGASPNNMKSISYDGSPYYFTAANFSDLGPVLAGIASAQCGGTLTVTKTIDGQVTAESQGWNFQAGGTNATIGGTNPANTNASGQAQWTVSNIAQAGGTVTVQETAVNGGFTFNTATCTEDGGPPESFSLNSGTRTASFKVLQGHVYACTFDNHKLPASGNIIIKKTGEGAGVGAGFVFSGNGTPFGVNGLTLNTPANGGTATSSTYPVTANTGSGYTVSENTPPTGWDFKSLSCDNPDGNDPSVVNGSSVAIKVSAGETVTCTWVNTKKSTIKVIKKVDGVQKAGWTVNATNPVSAGDDHAGFVVTVDPGTADFTLTKTAAGGFVDHADRGGSDRVHERLGVLHLAVADGSERRCRFCGRHGEAG